MLAGKRDRPLPGTPLDPGHFPRLVFAAGGVRRRVQAGRINRAFGEARRGVNVLRAHWYGALSGELVAAAARHYLGELDRLSSTDAQP